jgi:hypothetical protein
MSENKKGHCPACGRKWTMHMGMVYLCTENQRLRKTYLEIKKILEKAIDVGSIVEDMKKHKEK